MALSGLDIYKKLPKTNCGDCKVPTCMAFAMKVASGQAAITGCPHIDKMLVEELGKAAAPPIKTVTIGSGEWSFKIGGELVLFRHEKTFVNPCAIGGMISDSMSAEEVDAQISAVKTLQYERVGLSLHANLLAVKSEDPLKMADLAKKVVGSSPACLMLMSEDVDALKAGVEAAKSRRPVLCGATINNADKVAELARSSGLPVVVKGSGLEEVAELTTRLESAGVKDLIIDGGARTIKQAFQDQVNIRRAAVKKIFRPLGYPTVVFPCEMTNDPVMQAIYASIFVAKYAGIVVLNKLAPESLFPLLVERLNLYTDPQRPMAQSPGIYPINNPDEKSPVLITSNFSLTYFIVSGELETGRIPAWLLVADTEGLSVLTAWAAGKFSADAIAPFVKKCGIEEKVKHRKIIIPGLVASISGELAEELKGWEVALGPREASSIIPFLKEFWK
jgi:acetyl-CoA decarbonylase/synthase complex subunit gamma